MHGFLLPDGYALKMEGVIFMVPTRCLFSFFRWFSLVLSVMLILSATQTWAISILDVADGDNDTGSILIAPNTPTQALAAGFEMTAGFTDVDIYASLTCLECEAQFYLMTDADLINPPGAIGPGSDFVSNVRAVTTIDTLSGGGFIDQSTLLFSGLTLDIGLYYLVMALTNNTESGAIWSATQTPIVTSVSGTLNSMDMMALGGGFNSTTPPISVFQPYEVNGLLTSLQFTLDTPTSTPTAIPEPATSLLFWVGIVGLAAIKKRRIA